MITVQFWGVRGTLPVPGYETVRYCGNTNCVTLHIDNKYCFIFDGGTEIKKLSYYIIKNNLLPFKGNIFISHPHWDHINGLPYFMPFYTKESSFEIFSTCLSNTTVEKLIFGQMDNIYFPVSKEKTVATLLFHEINEEIFYIDDIKIKTMKLSHPGTCIGYRVEYEKKSFCYITDNELFPIESKHYNLDYRQKLKYFIKKTDFLFIDTTYTDKLYKLKECWGHSSVSQVIDLVDHAKVNRVCLFHHDPSQTDHDIDLKYKHAKLLLKKRNSKTKCIAPKEGDRLFI